MTDESECKETVAQIYDRARRSDTTVEEAWERIQELAEEHDWDLSWLEDPTQSDDLDEHRERVQQIIEEDRDLLAELDDCCNDKLDKDEIMERVEQFDTDMDTSTIDEMRDKLGLDNGE